MGQTAFNPPSCNSSSSTLPKFYPRGSFPSKSKREQNADRQRQFRKRNPGYYQRLHAERRAQLKAMLEERLAAEQLQAQQTQAIEAQVTLTIAAQEAVTIAAREPIPVVAQETAHASPVTSAPTTQEAVLLLMLMAALGRLQKQRAEAWY